MPRSAVVKRFMCIEPRLLSATINVVDVSADPEKNAEKNAADVTAAGNDRFKFILRNSPREQASVVPIRLPIAKSLILNLPRTNLVSNLNTKGALSVVAPTCLYSLSLRLQLEA